MSNTKTYYMSTTSEVDNKHIGQLKVDMEEGYERDDVRITYCTKGGCDLTFKLCSRYCPYAERECVYKDRKYAEYKKQLAIMKMNSLFEKHGQLLIPLIEKQEQTDEDKTAVIDLLSWHLSENAVREFFDFNQEICLAVLDKMKKIELARKLDNVYLNVKHVGEYIFLDMQYLPEVKRNDDSRKSYWVTKSHFGHWIKISDIDEYFLQKIAQPDYCNREEEKKVYYAKISLLHKYLEDNFGLMTMFSLNV